MPEFGAHATLLLGFLLLVDAGLLAIAIARRMPIPHALGAMGTIVVLARAGSRARTWWTKAGQPALIFTSGFVALYLGALPLARRFGRPFEGAAVRTGLAAPLSLLVFPVLVGIEPAFVRPVPPFGTLLALLVVIAWRATVEAAGSFYYVASFFAIAAQAIWSASYLTDERLGTRSRSTRSSASSRMADAGAGAPGRPAVATGVGQRRRPARQPGAADVRVARPGQRHRRCGRSRCCWRS